MSNLITCSPIRLVPGVHSPGESVTPCGIPWRKHQRLPDRYHWSVPEMPNQGGWDLSESNLAGTSVYNGTAYVDITGGYRWKPTIEIYDDLLHYSINWMWPIIAYNHDSPFFLREWPWLLRTIASFCGTPIEGNRYCSLVEWPQPSLLGCWNLGSWLST